MNSKLPLILVLSMVLFVQNIYGQISVHNSKEDELSATAWMLSGAGEFNRGIYEPYYKDLQKHFKPYKNHPVVGYIRDTLRTLGEDGIAYDAIARAAVYFEIEDDKFEMMDGYAEKLIAEKTYNRWTIDAYNRYITLLEDFYKVSNFESFYTEHKELYAQAKREYEQFICEDLKPEWFVDFYGKKFPPLDITLCLGYGYGAYGAIEGEANRGVRVESAMGITNPYNILSKDSREANLRVLIHEISHSFTEAIFDDYREELTQIGTMLYPHFSKTIERNNYTKEFIILESLNEACTVAYLDKLLEKQQIESYNFIGLVWMEELMAYLQNFTNNRDKYETISDFMPKFMGKMRDIAHDSEALLREKVPYIEEVTPKDGAEISANVDEIRVRFSRPMSTEFTGVYPIDQEGVNNIYKTSTKIYWEDDRTLVYKNFRKLKPGESCGLIVPSSMMYSIDMVHPHKDYDLIFKVQ